MLLHILTIVCALGCGLIAGVFFAFSTFVMKALAQQPPAQGVAAMQAINVVVINPVFLAPFVGTAAACAVLAVVAVIDWSGGASVLIVAGCVLYIVGTFGVTMRCNVPLNDRLAAVVPTSADAPARWTGYVARWTAWNHVRTAAGLTAAACLTVAVA